MTDRPYILRKKYSQESMKGKLQNSTDLNK